MDTKGITSIHVGNTDIQRVMNGGGIVWEYEEKFYNLFPGTLTEKEVSVGRNIARYDKTISGEVGTKLRVNCNVEKLSEFKFYNTYHNEWWYSNLTLSAKGETYKKLELNDLSDGVFIRTFLSSYSYFYFAKNENGTWSYVPDGTIIDEPKSIIKIKKISNTQYEFEIKKPVENIYISLHMDKEGSWDFSEFKEICRQCEISVEINKEVIN